MPESLSLPGNSFHFTNTPYNSGKTPDTIIINTHVMNRRPGECDQPHRRFINKNLKSLYRHFSGIILLTEEEIISVIDFIAICYKHSQEYGYTAGIAGYTISCRRYNHS